jgi:hypothetical protein
MDMEHPSTVGVDDRSAAPSFAIIIKSQEWSNSEISSPKMIYSSIGFLGDSMNRVIKSITFAHSWLILHPPVGVETAGWFRIGQYVLWLLGVFVLSLTSRFRFFRVRIFLEFSRSMSKALTGCVCWTEIELRDARQRYKHGRGLTSGPLYVPVRTP